MIRRPGKAAILDEAAVRVIRRMHEEGTLDVREAADTYGVGLEAIRRVARKETWRHVKDVPVMPEAEMTARIAASQEKLLAMLAKEGTRIETGAKMQEELGIAVPDAIKRQAEMLTGRKFGAGPDSDNVLPPDGEPIPPAAV